MTSLLTMEFFHVPKAGWLSRKYKELAHLPQRSGVYQFRNISNGKLYVGSAINVRKRCRVHLKLLREDVHFKYLQRAWNKYGADCFVIEVIELVDVEILRTREQHWLDVTQCYLFKNGYNRSRRADQPPALPQTAAQRASASRRFKGVPKSPEHRRKIGEAQKGKIISDEQRAKISASVKATIAANSEKRGGRKKGCVAWNKNKKLTYKQFASMRAWQNSEKGRDHIENFAAQKFKVKKDLTPC